MRVTDADRWQEYDDAVRRVVNCPDPECSTEDHVRSLRFIVLCAYNDGLAAEQPTRTLKGLAAKDAE